MRVQLNSLIAVGIFTFIGVFFYITLGRGVGSAVASRSTVEDAIQNQAVASGIELAIVKGIVKIESNFNPNAVNPSDPSYGLMQITPGLAYDYKMIKTKKITNQFQKDTLLNVKNNLFVGCSFLRNLLNKYSMDRAVQAYNVGEWGYMLGRRNPEYLKKFKEAYNEYN